MYIAQAWGVYSLNAESIVAEDEVYLIFEIVYKINRARTPERNVRHLSGKLAIEGRSGQIGQLHFAYPLPLVYSFSNIYTSRHIYSKQGGELEFRLTPLGCDQLITERNRCDQVQKTALACRSATDSMAAS